MLAVSTNVVSDFFNLNNSKIYPLVFTIILFFYRPTSAVTARISTNNFTGICFSSLIFPHFSSIDSFVLNFTAIQTNPNIYNFKYQNSHNSNYLCSSLRFFNQIRPTVWARKILDSLNPHPLSRKSCQYVYAAVFFLFPDSRSFAKRFDSQIVWLLLEQWWIQIFSEILTNIPYFSFPNELLTLIFASPTAIYFYFQYLARCGYRKPPFHPLHVNQINFWCFLRFSEYSALNIFVTLL